MPGLTSTPVNNETLYFAIPNYLQNTGMSVKVGTDEYSLKDISSYQEPSDPTEKAAYDLMKSNLTHYAENVSLPTEECRMLKVISGKDDNGIPQIALMGYWIPIDQGKSARQKYMAAHEGWVPAKFQIYGVDPGQQNYISYMAVWDRFYGPYDVAHFLCATHPEMANMNGENAALVREVSWDCPTYYELGDDVVNGNLGKWSTASWVKDEEGTTVYFPNTQNPAYQYDVSDKFEGPLNSILKDAIRETKAEELLEEQIWHPINGIANVKANATPPNENNDTSSIANELEDASSMFAMGNPSSNAGFNIEMESASLGEIKMKFTNSYVRYLGIYARFYGADGNPITGTDLKQNFSVSGRTSEDPVEVALETIGASDHDKFLFLINLPSESVFMGIPVGDTDREVTFDWESSNISVSKIEILAGTLGAKGCDADDAWKTVWRGLIYTTFFDLVMPAFSIAMTVGSSGTATWQAMFKKPTVIIAISKTIYAIVKEIEDPSHNNGEALAEAILSLMNKLIGALLKNDKFIAAIAEYIAAEEVAEAIPIIGKVLKGVLVASSVAELAQTTVEIFKSPMCISTDITLQMSIDLTINHDPANTIMPAGADHCDVILKYDDGATRTTTLDVSKLTDVSSYHTVISGLPVGGNVTIIIHIYASDDTLAGHVTSKLISNIPDTGTDTLTTSVTIKQDLHPLDANTYYEHYAKIQYKDDYHTWVQTKVAPTETAADLDKLNSNPGLWALDTITFNADNGIIGYAYAANFQDIPLKGHTTPDNSNTIHVMSNITLANDEPMYVDKGYMFSKEGLSHAPGMVYLRSLQESISLPSKLSPDKNHDFFYIDPAADESNKYHLRQIIPVIDQATAKDSELRQYDVSQNTSWGTFNGVMPDDFAIHATGYMAAVCSALNQILVLKVPAKGVNQTTEVPPHALPGSGKGKREGLVDQPIKLEMSPDGRILVLEAGNGMRVQAFDCHINPVKSFKTSAGDNQSSFFQLFSVSTKEKPLDIAVEAKGYIYVIMTDDTEYYLDVYKPDGTHVFRTESVRCGAITVDLWRNLFALNYEMMRKGGTGAPEPTISQWLPIDKK